MRGLVRNLAIGRIVFGAAMLLQPERAVRGWIGASPAGKPGTQTVTKAFGARDLALGAGTLAALARGDARDWVAAAGACDVVDLLATLRGEELPRSGRLIVGALASSAIAVSAAYLAAGSKAAAQ
jgi:hypothetical protein